MLVEELEPQASLSHTPLVQVGFTLQTAPANRFEMTGLSLEVLNAEQRHGQALLPAARPKR